MPALNPPRSVLEANFNFDSVHQDALRGGHFARLEQPKLFVEDVTKFLRNFA
jgi:hypothetical protein